MSAIQIRPLPDDHPFRRVIAPLTMPMQLSLMYVRSFVGEVFDLDTAGTLLVRLSDYTRRYKLTETDLAFACNRVVSPAATARIRFPSDVLAEFAKGIDEALAERRRVAERRESDERRTLYERWKSDRATFTDEQRIVLGIAKGIGTQVGRSRDPEFDQRNPTNGQSEAQARQGREAQERAQEGGEEAARPDQEARQEEARR